MKLLSLLILCLCCATAQAGSVTLSWTPPTQNTDGTPLTNLAGYRVYKATSPSGLKTAAAEIANPSTTSYVLDGVSPGSWYFAVSAFALNGKESALSNVVTKSVVDVEPIEPVPNPPVLAIATTVNVAYRLDLGYANQIKISRIGTVPPGTPCNAAMPAMGLYVIKDRHRVVLDSGKSVPLQALSKCE